VDFLFGELGMADLGSLALELGRWNWCGTEPLETVWDRSYRGTLYLVWNRGPFAQHSSCLLSSSSTGRR